MRFFSIVALLAAAVAAQEPTTTATSTTTLTLTITKCNPTNPSCPLATVTSTQANITSYHLTNTTVSCAPTASSNSSSLYLPGPTSATVSLALPSGPPTVSASGAGMLAVQAGVLFSALGMGVAMLV
jgi:hypothetical protein